MSQKYFEIKPEETKRQFIRRVCAAKDVVPGLTWDDICANCNKELGIKRGESWYRKNYKKGFFDDDNTLSDAEMFEDKEINLCERIEKISSERQQELNNDDSENNILFLQQINDATNDLIKEKMKLQELRNSNMAMLRRMSREDTIIEIANGVADKIKLRRGELIPKEVKNVEESSKSLIAVISDWHYGRNIDIPQNHFDSEECVKRVNMLYQKIVSVCRRNKIKEIYLVNLSDLIAGRIHTQLRIESREDVITQTLQVQEILIEFIENLSTQFKVHYYDCLDNHSRLEPNKKESIELETLTRVIFATLKKVFVKNPNVDICDNDYTLDIIRFNCRGFKIVGVHGDKDKPNKAITGLSGLLQEHVDLVLTAHLHHFSCNEQNETLILSNGALMGTDDYAFNLRLNSKASQNLIVVSDDNVAEEIIRVVLN